MDLSDDLRRPLEAAVFAHLGNNASVIAMELLNASAMRHAPAVANNYHYARWVVQYTVEQVDPALFIRVVEAVDPGGALPEVHALVARLRADPGEWKKPPRGGLWVPDGWPFIDRAPLRETLAEMAAGEEPSALAIEGPLGRGKRTIGEYVRQLARDTGRFSPAIVELRREPRGGLVRNMMVGLSIALGVDPDLRTTQPDPQRRATVQARRLAHEAMSAPSPAWFVAIVIDHTGLEEGVITFLDTMLGLLKETPALGQKLRVLVFCEELSVLGLENAPPLEARHALTHVTDEEIGEWLEAAAPGKPPELYRLSASFVTEWLNDVEHSDSERLRLISKGCVTAHRRLLTMHDA